MSALSWTYSDLDAARQLACSHLAMFGQQMEAPTDVLAIAEGLGIVVVSAPIESWPTFTGLALAWADGMQQVLVNSLLPRGRWAFTVAHEVGHLTMEHRPPRWLAQERLADTYASELLMPAGRVLTQVRRYGQDVETLCALNAVSRTAMQWRLRELAGLLATG